jgi:hypothetical protein
MCTARGRFATVAGSIGVLALTGVPVRAQSKMWEVTGNARADHLGASLTYVPDVDGDGVVDILAGATNERPLGWFGRAYLYSGATMTLLREFDGDTAGDNFGKIVADLGDVDGDGLRDFAIAAPDRSVPGQPLGAIFIESGTGSILRTITSAKSTGQVGLEMSYLEDVDGDGVRDFLYDDRDVNTYTAYTVFVVSGATGATIRTHSITAGADGIALNRTGDVDADGVDDYAFYDNGSGGIGVHSGATGGVLFVVPLNYPVVRPAGDVDQDGHGDLILSDRNGSVPVVSGATGQTLYIIKAGSTLGVAVSATGDFNHDGHPDLVVTHIPGGINPYDANIYSGVDGALLASLSTETGGAQARSLDATEDLDGDGVCDVLAGNGLLAPGGFGSSGGLSVTSEATLNLLGEVFGNAFASEVGFGFTILGDFDGDGFRELALLEPGGPDDTGKNVVQVVSGADGHELFRFSLAGSVGQQGGEIVRIGDVNGDGIEDLAVETSTFGWVTSSAEIHSGADGSLLGSLVPPAGFLQHIASAVDFSGRPLLALSASQPAAVYVFDLTTNALVTTFTSFTWFYASSVSCAGDLDRDGNVDWVVQDGSSGSIDAFSGATGATLWTSSVTFGAGAGVVGTGDIDGDGIADVLVSFGGYVGGSVQALSGKSGSQIFKMTSNANGFGASAVSLGDVNGDGVDDFAVGASDANAAESGSVFLYSGATRALLDRIDGDDAWLQLGTTLPKLPWGDDTRIDGDAIPDLVSGGYAYDENRGRVEVFRLDDLFLQIDPSTAAPGQFVWLNTRGGRAGTIAGLFAVSIDGAPVDKFIAFGTLDASGTWSVGATILPSLSGHVLTLRSYAIGFQNKVVDSQDETLTIQ